MPGPHDDPTNDFFNMTVTLRDGTRYALNVWTFDALQTIRREAVRDGEGLGGRYLAAPDLFVEQLDRALLEATVADMLARDALDPAWLAPRLMDAASEAAHCCARMRDAVTTTCPEHPDRFDCPDALIDYGSGAYGLAIHDGGHSRVRIQFCPFCGARLPSTSE